MGTQNSLVSFATNLLLSVFKDVERMHPGIAKDIGRDVATVMSRSTCEGLGFFTKSLPKLGKAIDLALQGHIPLRDTGFARSHGSALPKFLRGLLGMVFSSTTGMILTDPCVPAISDLRQISYILYKLELPYEPKVTARYTERFVSTDVSLPCPLDAVGNGNPPYPDSPAREISQIAGGLLRRVLSGFQLDALTPKHGPGEVATGEKAWEKFRFKRYYPELMEEFNFDSYFCLSPTQFVDEVDLDTLEEIPLESTWSRLAFVPKDSRGPRLIALEPLEYMWIQQGIKGLLYDYLEKAPLTKGQINFRDQTVNQELALEGSISQDLVTLDMKDASDRVSLRLVQTLFSGPLLKALLCTRTPNVKLPDGTIHKYNKFAPMGSALCFPVEAMCFWALAVASIMFDHKVPLEQAARSVWVYGDDIITHRPFVDSLLRAFPLFDLVFNEGKCCTHGHFRESCGVDAYKGEIITPLRVKSTPPTTKRDANALISFVAYSNNFWQRGYYTVATMLKDIVESLLGDLPVLPFSMETGALAFKARVGFDDCRRTRWSRELQRPLKKSWVIKSGSHRLDESEITWSEVLRCILPHSEDLRAGVYGKRYQVYLRSRYI